MASRKTGPAAPRADVDKSLSILVTDTRQFVCALVKEHCPDVLGRLPADRKGKLETVDDIAKTGDPTAFLAVLAEAWDEAFSKRVNAPGVNFQLVDKVRRIRNDLVHDVDRKGSPEDIQAILDLRNALVSSPDYRGTARPYEYHQSPKSTGNRRSSPSNGSRSRPSQGARPGPNSGPRPRPTPPQTPPANQLRRKILRLAYFSGLMTVACVLGILAGVIAVYVGFSNDLAFMLWL